MDRDLYDRLREQFAAVEQYRFNEALEEALSNQNNYDIDCTKQNNHRRFVSQTCSANIYLDEDMIKEYGLDQLSEAELERVCSRVRRETGLHPYADNLLLDEDYETDWTIYADPDEDKLVEVLTEELVTEGRDEESRQDPGKPHTWRDEPGAVEEQRAAWEEGE